jgi:hypothetical protein
MWHFTGTSREIQPQLFTAMNILLHATANETVKYLALAEKQLQRNN